MTVGLVVEILGDASKLNSELDKSEGSVKGWGGALGSSAVKVAAVAGAVGIAAVAISGMTDAAAADAAEQEKLEAAIRASGAATGDWQAQTEAAIAAAQEKAFTDTEAREALQSLVTATGSVTEATALMSSAQDIARFAGVDLAAAADAIAKAEAGSDGALRKLIPGLEKGATASDTLAAATKAAAGQADTYAESAAGMQAKGSNAFDELTETIGAVFLPVLEAILPALIPLLKAFGELVESILPVITPLLKLLGQALGIVAGAISGVVSWLSRLISWLSTAIGKIGQFLDSINPFKNISLPSLPFLSSAPAGAAGPMARAGFGAAPLASGGPAGITINIIGDPELIQRTVIRSLRDYGRRNAFGEPAAATRRY
jgi:hypothetical protein